MCCTPTNFPKSRTCLDNLKLRRNHNSWSGPKKPESATQKGAKKQSHRPAARPSATASRPVSKSPARGAAKERPRPVALPSDHSPRREADSQAGNAPLRHRLRSVSGQGPNQLSNSERHKEVNSQSSSAPHFPCLRARPEVSGERRRKAHSLPSSSLL